MTKIVYNACYGGFSLSDAAIMRYAEIKGITLYPHAEKRYGFISYYLCPPEEWMRINNEEYNSPLGPGPFDRSNALYFSVTAIERTDPALVQAVEDLGDAANGDWAELRITEVRAGTRYRIDEYDGLESVMTIDDYDWKMA
jgi:hypothetical protein